MCTVYEYSEKPGERLVHVDCNEAGDLLNILMSSPDEGNINKARGHQLRFKVQKSLMKYLSS